MLRLAADLSSLFPGIAPLDRPDLAAAAGFAGVAMAEPWDLPAQDLRDRLAWAKLPLASFCAPPPNYAGGEPGWAGQTDLAMRFRSDLRRALRLAGILRPAALVLRPGPQPQEAALAEALGHAAEAAPELPLLLATGGDLPLERALPLVAAHPRLRLDAPAEALQDASAETLARIGQVRVGAAEDPLLLYRLEAMGWDGWVVVAGEAGRLPSWIAARLLA